MRMQRWEWSCGPASIVNAFRCFGIKLDEAHVLAQAGSVSPARCAHCRAVTALLDERTCTKSKWSCRCQQCVDLRRVWRSDCEAGTSEQGILKAVRYFGNGSFTAQEYSSDRQDEAWEWLHGSLIHGKVVILCINSWTHWCLALGTSGDRVIVFDPYPSKSNQSENGIHVLDKADLMRRWLNARQWVGREKRLYAISVGRR